MADDNFEDDLFADLYTDDNAAKDPPKPAEVKTEEPVQPEVKAGELNAQVDEGRHNDEHTQNGDQEEEDDEIDFNLGNGNNYNSPQGQDNSSIGIKEDG